MKGSRLDGVLPTAVEALERRRETHRCLQSIDRLLYDDVSRDSSADRQEKSSPGLGSFDAGPFFGRSAPRISFGSSGKAGKTPRPGHGRSRNKTPGPGSYDSWTGEAATKRRVHGAGASGLRSNVCCRFQPCECGARRVEPRGEAPPSEETEFAQDSKQPRRRSPPLVAYPESKTTSKDHETREKQSHLQERQLAERKWRHVGFHNVNYRSIERRRGGGGALSMSRSSGADVKTTASVKLRKLLVDNRARGIQTERVGAAAAKPPQLRDGGDGIVAMDRLAGRDAVHCRRKGQRVVHVFGD